MCIGRVSSGNRTLLGIQRRGRVGVVSSSSKLATLSCSSSPRYYWEREREMEEGREKLNHAMSKFELLLTRC